MSVVDETMKKIDIVALNKKNIPKSCPIRKCKCTKDKCEWFMEDQCAIIFIAFSLKQISEDTARCFPQKR